MKLYKYNNDQIRFIHVPIIKLLLVPIILISVLLIYSFIFTEKYLSYNNEKVYLENEIKELKHNNDELLGIIELLNESNDFSEENLYLVLEGLNILYPHIVMAQSKLETSYWKSDIFIESGNLFGMKPARMRPHTHFGDHRGHADYKGNWKLSAIDYALWQSREARNVKTENQYYFLLSKLYAEDPEYVNKLKNIVSKQEY
jgi:hypothetical protein